MACWLRRRRLRDLRLHALLLNCFLRPGVSRWVPAFRIPTPADNSSKPETDDDEVQCPWSFKVWIYKFPEDLKWMRSATELKESGPRRHDRPLDIFALEILLHKIFEKSCVRTMDPEEADFKLVPYYTDIDFHMGNKPKHPTIFMKEFANVILGNVELWEEAFNVTGDYWLKNRGWDHIITFLSQLASYFPRLWHGWNQTKRCPMVVPFQ